MVRGEKLTRLAAGCWIPKGDVLSVIATGGCEQLKLKPHVVLKTAIDTLSWEFDTWELATKFADHLARLCNGEDEKLTTKE
jgi:hypothetical protein